MSSLNQKLTEKHLHDLRTSGLTDQTIEASGIYSGSAEEVRSILGFHAGTGMVIPYHGTAPRFLRVKPDTPFPTTDGKVAKYLSPKKEVYPAGNRLYIPPFVDKSILSDPGTELVITEGEKKALACCQAGIPCIALAGVTCWKSRDLSGRSHPIADLDRIAWRERRTFICFDSDLMQKRSVQVEFQKLSMNLVGRGAIPLLVFLPSIVEEVA